MTIARRSLAASAADELATDAPRHSKKSAACEQPALAGMEQAIAPVVAARRRRILLGDKQAVRILFDPLASRFENRDGGYTRIIHLAAPRLGDASPRAILEFVGVRDRAAEKAAKPTIEPERPSRKCLKLPNPRPLPNRAAAGEEVTA